MKTLYIGLDGGGTRTTAVAAWPDGRIAAQAKGGGLNYLNDGLEQCLDRFQRIVKELLTHQDADEIIVCAGLAALDGPADQDILAAFRSVLPAQSQLILESDLTVALTGHTLGAPGLMAVCGTGSMILAMDDHGIEHVAGGWGWKIGDPGSGYALAREGLEKAMQTYDEKGLEIPLLTAALSYFSASSSRGLMGPLYLPDAGPAVLASFGAEVIRLAECDDHDALHILSRQMDALAALAAGLLKRAPQAQERAALYGGIFQHSSLARALFTKALQSRCPDIKPDLLARSPALGAVILAMLRQGMKKEAMPDFTEEKNDRH